MREYSRQNRLGCKRPRRVSTAWCLTANSFPFIPPVLRIHVFSVSSYHLYAKLSSWTQTLFDA